MSDVQDPSFAHDLVGPGIAVEPDAVPSADVRAPADGRLGAVYPHAIAVELGGGRSVLVHLGIDTVELHGVGFTVHVQVGDVVTAGQVLVTWSPQAVREAGLATICPVVAVQADPAGLTLLAPIGSHVHAGDPLLSWD
jgi:PTS system glucose-specific IIA component